MNNDFQLKDSNKIAFNVDGKGTIKVYPPLDNLEVTPGKETLVIKNNEKYGYDTVTINKIPDEYIIPSGVISINENGIKDVTEYKNVLVNVEGEAPEIKLQTKEVTPTKENQNIVADNGYDGLSKVKVKPIVLKNAFENIL